MTTSVMLPWPFETIYQWCDTWIVCARVSGGSYQWLCISLIHLWGPKRWPKSGPITCEMMNNNKNLSSVRFWKFATAYSLLVEGVFVCLWQPLTLFNGGMDWDTVEKRGAPRLDDGTVLPLSFCLFWWAVNAVSGRKCRHFWVQLDTARFIPVKDTGKKMMERA